MVKIAKMKGTIKTFQLISFKDLNAMYSVKGSIAKTATTEPVNRGIKKVIMDRATIEKPKPTEACTKEANVMITTNSGIFILASYAPLSDRETELLEKNWYSQTNLIVSAAILTIFI